MVFTKELMEPLFALLENCRGVEQMEEHHPEGDVFVHSLQCYWWACRETNDTDLILAALLHDVGKAVIGKGHEKESVELIREYVSAKTCWLVEQHMRVWAYIQGEMRKLSKCKYLAEHPWLPELIQLARFDKLARNPRKKVKYNREDIIETLNKIGMSRFQKEG